MWKWKFFLITAASLIIVSIAEIGRKSKNIKLIGKVGGREELCFIDVLLDKMGCGCWTKWVAVNKNGGYLHGFITFAEINSQFPRFSPL